METSLKFPQKLIVRIMRADNLLIKADKKGKNQIKWRVIVMGCRKRCMTEYSPCPLGNPIWNCDLNLKLLRNQSDSIALVVVDFSGNQVGQVVVPMAEINVCGSVNDPESGSMKTLKCSELEPSRKCASPTGHLFYCIGVDEYFPDEITPIQMPNTKRHSIFGWKQDLKKPNLADGATSVSISEKSKVSKRLSVFKSIGKSENSMFRAGKAKSLANIYTADLAEEHESSDSDIDKHPCFPPDKIYDHVTQDLGWVRVGDIAEDRHLLRLDTVSGSGGENEKVEVWSVQPDNGPISEESHIFTPREPEAPCLSVFKDKDSYDLFEDPLLSSTQCKSGNAGNSEHLKRDSGMGSYNERINGKSGRRRLSDYGSQGSIYSERASSGRRKVNRQPTMSKMELFEEVTILRKEVTDLQIQLKELASSTSTQITAFKCQLESRDAEIDNISHILCNLKVKLLEDGLTQYLELK